MTTLPTEHHEQVMLFQWLELMANKHPELAAAFAIPNAGGYSGGFRSNVARVQRMKREGVRSGVPDVFVPVPRGGFHGLFLELKRQKGGSITPEQKAWHAVLIRHGYQVAVCKGFEAAKQAVESYLTPTPSAEAAA
jgi:hypothetical protein